MAKAKPKPDIVTHTWNVTNKIKPLLCQTNSSLTLFSQIWEVISNMRELRNAPGGPDAARRLVYALNDLSRSALEFRDRLARALEETDPFPAQQLPELRRAMADAHPDRGGSEPEFTAARNRYMTARGKSSY